MKRKSEMAKRRNRRRMRPKKNRKGQAPGPAQTKEHGDAVGFWAKAGLLSAFFAGNRRRR